MDSTGFLLSYSQDYGNWDYTVSLPIQRTLNNGSYSALNNTQIGLTVAPTYHLFLEQVHGATLNVGARLGYSHTGFADTNAVRDPAGQFKLANFSNANTTFASLNANFGKQIMARTRLNLGTEALVYHNDGAQSVMGSNGNMYLLHIGVSQLMTEKFILNGSLQSALLKQNSFNSKTYYNTLGFGGAYRIDRRSSMTANLSSMIGSQDFKSNTILLGYRLDLQ